MSSLVIDVEGATRLDVSHADDVSVVGSDEERIFLSGDREVEVTRDGETIYLTTSNDLNVRMPRRLHLRLGNLGGDARVFDLGAGLTLENADDARIEAIRGDVAVGSASGDVTARAVDGTLRVEHAAGDLRLDGCRGAVVGPVAGDLRVVAVEGELQVGSVGGDVHLENCADQVRLENVGGNLVARNLAGGIDAPNVGGDARLQTAFAPGRTYRVHCGGSADILLAGNLAAASAAFEIRCGSREVNCSLPLQDVTRQPGFLRGSLGSGEATVQVESGGDARLASVGAGRGFEGGFESMMDQIGESIEASIEGALSGMFGEGPGREFQRRMEDLGERIARQAEQAARRAEEIGRRESEKAARRAERIAEKAARQAGRQAERGWRWNWGSSGGWGGFPGVPPTPPRPAPPVRPGPPPPPRATDEERLVILRMLSEGMISAEDAARLLDALGG